MLVLAEIFEYLGIHKNPLLVFVLLSAKFVHEIGKELMAKENTLWVRNCGVALHIVPAVMIVAVLIFYCIAYRSLPGSTQELEFERSSEKALKKHHTAGRRRQR
jgi:hypothetical protein